MADLSVTKEKNALKTAEMSGKRAKTRHFPYIKQNSIAEIVSTMESFFARSTEKDIITTQNKFPLRRLQKFQRCKHHEEF